MTTRPPPGPLVSKDVGGNRSHLPPLGMRVIKSIAFGENYCPRENKLNKVFFCCEGSFHCIFIEENQNRNRKMNSSVFLETVAIADMIN